MVVDAGQSVPSEEVARSSGQCGAILQRAGDRGWLGKSVITVRPTGNEADRAEFT